MLRGEMVLLSRAVRGRWPIPDELKGMLLGEAARISFFAPDLRTRVSAIRAILAMDVLNLSHEQFLRDMILANKVDGLEQALHDLENRTGEQDTGDRAEDGGHRAAESDVSVRP